MGLVINPWTHKNLLAAMFKGESSNGTDLQKPAGAGFIYCCRSLSFEVTGINFVTRKRNILSPGIGTLPTDPMKMQETPRLRNLYPIGHPYRMIVAVDAAMMTVRKLPLYSEFSLIN